MAEPWKTIAKVNATALRPGQSVGFKRGEVWREMLTPGQSGTPGSPITFAAYGVGAQPIISGADLVSSWTADAPGNMLLWNDDLTKATWRGSTVWQSGNASATDFETINVTASAASNTWQQVAVSPSTTYTFSFLAKAGTLTTPKYSVYDWTWTHRADIISSTSYAGSINSRTFSRISVTFTTPTGCTSIGVYPERDGIGTGTVFVTQVQLVPGSSAETNSIYYAGVISTPNQVFWDSARMTVATSKTLLAPGSWWGSTFLYVYDNPTGHNIEVSQRSYAVYGTGETYLTVSDIEAGKSNYRGVYCNTCNGLLVTGVTALWNFDEGIKIDWGSGIVVSYSTAAHNGSNGFGINSAPRILLDHLISHDNAELPTMNYTAGIKFNDNTQLPNAKSAPNMTVQYSVVYNNGVGQPDQRGLGIWADTVADGFTAKYNIVYGNNLSGILAEADSKVSILYNIVYGTLSQAGIALAGILVEPDNPLYALSDSLIANNVSYGNSGVGILIGIFAPGGVPGGCVRNSVVNNIAIGNTGGQLWTNYGCENPGTNGYGNIYTHNDFGAQASNFIMWGTGNYYSTFTTWETAAGNCGFAGCSHSVQLDPLFTNPSAADFTLQPGSPAIGAGVYMSGVSLANLPNIGPK
jgi:hypothetical protein